MADQSSRFQLPSAERLAGKVALVTGAARGIGAGIALCLAEEGVDVVVNDLPPDGVRDGGAETARAVIAAGRRARIEHGDVSRREDILRVVGATVEHFGRLDILVANAAYSDREPVISAAWEKMLRTIEVTQFGVVHACQHAAAQMVRQGGGGKIIIIGSVLGELPFATSSAYNMAKAAVNHFGRTLAAELSEHRINVNIINPGYIDTPGERKFATEAEILEFADRVPWRRLGTPRDIGRAAVFLASDDADYVTGAALVVDGGYRGGMRLPLRSL